MYSKAILPATAITEVARQSAKDDADANRDVSEHTQRLAGMVHKANANRGVRHLVTPWLPVEPYFVDVCYKNDADELTPMKIPLVLPHEFVHEMYNRGDDTFNNQFFFGQDGDVDTNLTRYWKHIAQVQPCMQSHPEWHDIQQHSHRCVPLRMHGDEICYNKRNAKMLVYNWCSVLSRGLPRRLCKVFMMGVRKAFLLSLDCLVLALSWSFACLLTGVMPSHDENCSPLEWVRAAKANMLIAGVQVPAHANRRGLGMVERFVLDAALRLSQRRFLLFMQSYEKCRTILCLGVYKQPWLVGHHGYPR